MKKVNTFIFTLLIFFVTFNVYAVTTYNRNELDNYGVNKKWDINSGNLSNVISAPKVNSKEKIYDFSEVLTEDDIQKLKLKIDNFISETDIDMVIVTVDLAYTLDNTNEIFAADFYDYNDFGLNLKNYSGILLFRNTYSNDPYFNIYTFGDAQLYFSYERCEKILDSIYYDLHSANYLSGFSTFIDLSLNYYKDGSSSDMKNYYVDDMGYLQKKFIPPISLATIIAVIVTLIVVKVLVNKNKMIKPSNNANEFLDDKSVNYTVKHDELLRTHTSSHHISSDYSGGHSSSGGGGSFHSSSGSSGGGHSSGGGRHG